ncbi:diaminopimelate epimerase [Megasphaera micronuciformis]|jgi:diaminopimelate epimerase|uniref:Diaminopimelate epimerase n=1 Tax=Megasphaera micronuciformis F0359 TaxID=706434 RepID=E2Z9I6_9FIRM|nr:diaminopimelate epimerase [Megasphaera micronuciformis]EFQ05012.1 diaminopimelate epimerase [Megasphaera micronuciformis F0359]
MDFVKMHGLGNDFVFIEDKTGQDKDYTALARAMCNRHTGIGADGLIVIVDSRVADVRMRIINSDGSEAEMCGNGIRCFAKYVYDSGIIEKKQFTVETPAGIMEPEITVGADNKAKLITINMGRPSFNRSEIPMEGADGRVLNEDLCVDGENWKVTSLLMGVPHTVTYVDDVDTVDIEKIGPLFEKHEAFPKHTNINFAQQMDDRTVKVRTWERGAGATLACGTGSCSVAVASFLNGRTGREVDIQLPLGTLHIEYREEDGNVYMTGPAAVSFTGTWPDET